MTKNTSVSRFLPVLFGFFIMGFVDMVGIATNYVKQDFKLSDTLANLLPMTLFLWFGISNVFSIIFAYALKSIPKRANDISGLLVMGIAGGAIVLLIMGVMADCFGQNGGMAILFFALTYLLFSAFKLDKKTNL